MIDGAREDEQEIGQAVHIREHLCIDLVRPKRDDRPLRAPADGSRKVQQRARLASAGQNKPSKRRQLGFELIDPLFETQHVPFADRRLRHAIGDLLRRIGETGTDRKEVSLQLFDQRSDISQLFAAGAHGAEARIELIDIAVRRDARVGFRNTRTAEQGRPARIARPRVNLHGRQYT